MLYIFVIVKTWQSLLPRQDKHGCGLPAWIPCNTEDPASVVRIHIFVHCIGSNISCLHLKGGPRFLFKKRFIIDFEHIFVCFSFQEGLEDLLQSLVQLLNHADFTIATCSAEILSNLTCNQRNKAIVCQVGGIEMLVRAIINAEKQEIIEPSVS